MSVVRFAGFHTCGVMLPFELHCLIVQAVRDLDDTPRFMIPQNKLPPVAHTSWLLRNALVWVMSQEPSRQSFPFPKLPIPTPTPDFMETGPPLLGWQQASPCAGLTPPVVNYTKDWAESLPVRPFDWELAVWFWSTFPIDLFRGIQAAQDHMEGVPLPEEEGSEDEGEDPTDAKARGYSAKAEDERLEGLGVRWMSQEDVPPAPLFPWPPGHEEVRVDEDGMIILDEIGSPNMGPDPLRFAGDAWKVLRRRVADNRPRMLQRQRAPDGTRTLVLPPALNQANPPPEIRQPKVAEVLVFHCLSDLATYFSREGPGGGAHAWILAYITYIFVQWRDENTGGQRWRSSWAYKAVEALVAARASMPRLRVLQIKAAEAHELTVDSPGI